MDDQVEDPFEKLPEEVYQLIFHAVSDCKTLVRCMAVSRAFREHSERVSSLSILCPGHFTSYVEKLQRIFSMVRRFHSLEVLIVRVGQPKDEPPSWARCMRYAEIGSSVEKFIFMAAKTGEFSDFDSVLRGLPIPVKEHKESSSEGEGDIGNERSEQARASGTGTRPTDRLNLGPSSPSSSATACRRFPEFSLRQVVAPSNDVLKRMVPVIVFAIVQGLDEFRDSVPAFIYKFKRLRTLLLVDMLESVTVFMREHQIQQIRSRQSEVVESARTPSNEDDENTREAEDERAQMSKFDKCSDRKGKSLGEGCSRDKGKQLEADVGEDACSSSRSNREEQKEETLSHEEEDEVTHEQARGETSSGVAHDQSGVTHGGQQEGKSSFEFSQEHEENPSQVGESSGNRESLMVSAGMEQEQEKQRGDSPGVLREHGHSPSAGVSRESQEYANVVRGTSNGGVVGQTNTSSFSSTEGDGSEAWRNCGGVYIHGPGDTKGEFSPRERIPFKRIIKGNRENRSMRIGSYRRRERSVDWMDESLRRRQEGRVYKGLSFRRREESRAFRTWRLAKRDRDENDASYNAQSVFEQPDSSSSLPSGAFGRPDANSEAAALSNSSIPVVFSSQELDPLAGCSVISRTPSTLHPLGDSSMASSGSSSTSSNQQERNRFPAVNVNLEQQRDISTSYRFGGSELATIEEGRNRSTWRETWGERLGRRARELRREMQMQNSEMEREGLRRERLREGVRKRQMEIEREALRFDITFWRAEEVVAGVMDNGNSNGNTNGDRGGERVTGAYKLTDVSMCIATHAAKPLGGPELDLLSGAALAGPLLTATIAHVNEQAGFHNL